MPKQFGIATLALLLIYASGPVAGQAQSNLRRADHVVIDRFIVKQQSEDTGFEDEGNERTMMIGDLNHDGLSDAVVLYMLEGQNGTNNYVQHLAVFVRRRGVLVPLTDAVVGGKYYRTAELKGIKNKQILFETLDYADNDARCCPSIKGKTAYVLKGAQLKEQRSKSK
ncbi:MAG TPA: hypothetical protein VFD62_17465 [Pyrinomonadaceae bacterium]|nr:hypothetical protein [Pyrinomonadaceae bacterium]